MLKVTFKFDEDKMSAAFAKAAADAEREMTRGIRQAAKDVALPIVRGVVAGKLPGTTSAGASRKGAYVRQNHPGAAIDEMGGTRRDVVRPVSAGALNTPAGPRAKVSGPRVYTAAHALKRGVEQARPAMAKPVMDAILVAYSNAGFEVS